MNPKIIGWVLWTHPNDEAADSRQRLAKAALKHHVTLQHFTAADIHLICDQANAQILIKGEIVPLPDFAMARTGWETTYYDLAIMRTLEQLGVAVINRADALKIANDKWEQFEIFAAAHLPIPKTILMNQKTPFEVITNTLKFPLVLKKIDGAFGKGVLLIQDKMSFIDVVQTLFSVNAQLSLIAQEFIAESKGTSIRAFVIDNEVVDVVKKTSITGNFKSLYNKGVEGTLTSYPLTTEINALVKKIMSLSKLDYTAIDFLISKDGLQICEINGSPGFSTHSDEIVERLITYIIKSVSKKAERSFL
jgi:RimK family alpha-L-glutamate ligase